MAELVVVQGQTEERVFFEVGPAPPVDGGRGADTEVSIRDWFKDRFHQDQDPGVTADIGTTIQEVASAAAAGFRGMATDHADGGNFAGAEVTFGVKVSAEGNAFVTKASVEANLSVTFKWSFTE